MRLAQDGREIGLARVVLSEGYFGPCRNVLGAPLGARIASLMTATSIDWPEIAFAPRSALVGVRTEIRLIPHLGEFDQAGLIQEEIGLRNASILLARAKCS